MKGFVTDLVVGVGASQAVRLCGRVGQRLVVLREVTVRVGAPQLVVPLLTVGERSESCSGSG